MYSTKKYEACQCTLLYKKIYIPKKTKYVQSSSLFPPLQEPISMCRQPSWGEQALEPFLSLISKRSLASSSASNLASAFFSRPSATSVVSTLVPCLRVLSVDQAMGPFLSSSCGCSAEADSYSSSPTESLPEPLLTSQVAGLCFVLGY